MKNGNRRAVNDIQESIWREICSYKAERRWVRPWRVPQPPVAANALRKLLKTERL
jgi:hypothetical protein